jgi:hypothetical protein
VVEEEPISGPNSRKSQHKGILRVEKKEGYNYLPDNNHGSIHMRGNHEIEKSDSKDKSNSTLPEIAQKKVKTHHHIAQEIVNE